MRTIVIHERDENSFENLINKTYNEDRNNVGDAIGYLSMWARNSERYAHCTLYLDDKNIEIIATYRPTADGEVTYQIGAVWHDDHFGFHS